MLLATPGAAEGVSVALGPDWPALLFLAAAAWVVLVLLYSLTYALRLHRRWSPPWRRELAAFAPALALAAGGAVAQPLSERHQRDVLEATLRERYAAQVVTGREALGRTGQDGASGPVGLRLSDGTHAPCTVWQPGAGSPARLHRLVTVRCQVDGADQVLRPAR